MMHKFAFSLKNSFELNNTFEFSGFKRGFTLKCTFVDT